MPATILSCHRQIATPCRDITPDTRYLRVLYRQFLPRCRVPVFRYGDNIVCFYSWCYRLSLTIATVHKQMSQWKLIVIFYFAVEFIRIHFTSDDITTLDAVVCTLYSPHCQLAFTQITQAVDLPHLPLYS